MVEAVCPGPCTECRLDLCVRQCQCVTQQAYWNRWLYITLYRDFFSLFCICLYRVIVNKIYKFISLVLEKQIIHNWNEIFSARGRNFKIYFYFSSFCVNAFGVSADVKTIFSLAETLLKISMWPGCNWIAKLWFVRDSETLAGLILTKLSLGGLWDHQLGLCQLICLLRKQLLYSVTQSVLCLLPQKELLLPRLASWSWSAPCHTSEFSSLLTDSPSLNSAATRQRNSINVSSFECWDFK